MSYPTNVHELLKLTEEEWEALLASVWSAPVPRVVVRLTLPVGAGMSKPGERLAYALERIAVGDKKHDIARALGVSPSLLSKILSGVRN